MHLSEVQKQDADYNGVLEGEGKMTDRGSLTQLRLWLQESIEFEDYLIKNRENGLTPRIQRACWYRVIEKIDEILWEEVQRREERREEKRELK
jgi:hypothetical protein